MKSTMRPIHSLIAANLLNRTQNIQSLTTSLHSRLSAELRQHCWVVDIMGNTIVIITDNAERATILRYQQHELVKQINEEFSSTLESPIRRIKVKVDFNLTKLSSNQSPHYTLTQDEVSKAKSYCKQMLSLLDKPNID